jgi:3'-phosphoadenosine 5'-phosphosulfate sulfotransferase (PAPS reductase)/FAD synthetase
VVVMFSGGKDSTAMLLKMIEKNYQIDDIVMADTGVEFPEMYDHVKAVQNYIGREITILKTQYPFGFMLSSLIRYKGKRKTYNKLIKDIYVDSNTGYGWPDMMNRWCTSQKKQAASQYLKGKKYTEFHGIAVDEKHRAEKNKGRDIKYPLIEWGMTEKECLQYCYDRGFRWGGLYEKMSRVSCYLCPLQRLSDLEVVYREYPELWNKMLDMDQYSFRRFRSDYSLAELTKKFKIKSLQGELF